MAQEPITPPHATPVTATVLVVDDQRIVRELTARMLRRRGYTVLAAATADEALTLDAEHSGSLELLLTDVVLPLQSGHELAAELATRRPGLRVLFVSGSQQHVGQPPSGVPSDFVGKPFTAEELLQRVSSLLDGVS